MTALRGSTWRRWDLHVHTPDSIVNHFGGSGIEAWDRYIEALASLPEDIKVLGINDYLFLDGYRRVVKAKQEGKLPNIDLILPVVELRIDKFGGSKSKLSRVNYHVIFSDQIDPDVIDSQFLAALCSKYVLSPEYDNFRTEGKWAAVPTRKSLEDLGNLIIESVPAHEREKFGSPLVEGFNNLCISLQAIRSVLDTPYFAGKTITAVGKTEWADIKWNEQSIADKKTIINSADLVFIASESPEHWQRAKAALEEAGVNGRILDCSDAHRHADSTDKDRLGNCCTWIKADPTFEGLRQAVFEYPNRIAVSETRPVEPLLQIRRVDLSFPPDAYLSGDGLRTEFCFRGSHGISFSPYLTCIIGGRGSGKSTLLNVLHEALEPGTTEFFKKNRILPNGTGISGCVQIDGIREKGVVEFLQQNEIEQFASDHERLTAAIFSRLQKLDSSGVLDEQLSEVDAALKQTQLHLQNVRGHHDVIQKLSSLEAELATQRAIVESFQDTDFTRISEAQRKLSKELQNRRSARAGVELLIAGLRSAITDSAVVAIPEDAQSNPYTRLAAELAQAISVAVREAEQGLAKPELSERDEGLERELSSLRTDLKEFLRKRGLSEENLADAGKTSERIVALEEQIRVLQGRSDKLKVEIAQFVPRRTATESYIQAVRSLLAPVNEALAEQGGEVKPIELQYFFDEKAFGSAMVQYVATAIGPIEGRAPRSDFIENRLAFVNFGALTDNSVVLAALANDDGVYARALRDFFSDPHLFELLRIEIELRRLDVQRLGRIAVLYDGRPVESSSFGQRCTAVIVVLLLLGNMPVVIDEPEAHLDSSLIANYLVDLIKRRKVQRQIIFSTHNANVVINGDAELVHCLSMNASKVTLVESTTIENLDHRGRLLALEGGKRAFQQRERRYGFE